MTIEKFCTEHNALRLKGSVTLDDKHYSVIRYIPLTSTTISYETKYFCTIGQSRYVLPVFSSTTGCTDLHCWHKGNWEDFDCSAWLEALERQKG